MFEALRWRNESAMRHTINSLAQAGKTPLVLGSLAAMAVVGVLTTMGINHKNGRSRMKVIPARVRAAIGDAITSTTAPRNGRRRRRRKMKAAAHKTTTH